MKWRLGYKRLPNNKFIHIFSLLKHFYFTNTQVTTKFQFQQNNFDRFQAVCFNWVRLHLIVFVPSGAASWNLLKQLFLNLSQGNNFFWQKINRFFFGFLIFGHRIKLCVFRMKKDKIKIKQNKRELSQSGKRQRHHSVIQ